MSGQGNPHLVALKAIEQKRALIRVNECVDRCFHQCIEEFGITRQLRPNEEQCVHNCTLKFLEMSAIVGQIFAQSDYCR
jgi:uncharacterized protein YcgL (UPF0745 family)